MPSRVVPPRHPADAQQPEVVQQRQEVLRGVEPLQGEARADVGLRLALADDVAQQVEVAVELLRARAHPLVHQQQVAQLRVVDANVGVDETARHRLVREGILQVMEYHAGVVEVAGGVLGEAVAVVPLAHHVEGGVHVLVERAALPVELQKAPHLRFGEAEHPVELRLQGDVAPDVEAASTAVGSAEGPGRVRLPLIVRIRGLGHARLGLSSATVSRVTARRGDALHRPPLLTSGPLSAAAQWAMERILTAREPDIPAVAVAST